ncbi:hypothetical protein M8C21_002637 [Ambrosia artemisiifolia]|uniref:Uncharacterized protein n=1 Tax=Ambrosia artemisiifolia TaxID=4212 RepID=A0AAD5D553_AMBAR|nr:hypothetical protein M8C21_002637 [Ambrosia artemisiifolia]
MYSPRPPNIADQLFDYSLTASPMSIIPHTLSFGFSFNEQDDSVEHHARSDSYGDPNPHHSSVGLLNIYHMVLRTVITYILIWSYSCDERISFNYYYVWFCNSVTYILTFWQHGFVIHMPSCFSYACNRILERIVEK